MPSFSGPVPGRSRPCLDIPDPELGVLAGTRHFNAETFGLFLACSRLITLGLAHVLSKWWERGDPVQAGSAERVLVQVELEKHKDSRFDKRMIRWLGKIHRDCWIRGTHIPE